MRIAIVGAGPRGTSVLERLLARLGPLGRARVDLIDPFPPGAGKVWRADQSPLYLMNTQSFFPTVVPRREASPPPLAGTDFDSWRERFRPELRREDFPPRAVYGQYLRWVFQELMDRAPSGVDVHWHRDEAVQLRRDDGPGFRLRLASGTELPADVVVLALGHVPAELVPGQQELARAADHWSLSYQPPAIPADVNWDNYPSGEPVLVRGMGLTFFDLLAQWTEGRGGMFCRSSDGFGDCAGGGRLEYVASGREPQIIAASRRGGPYRAKPGWPAYYPPGLTMPFLTETLAALRARAERAYPPADGAQEPAVPGFVHDIWPGLHKDVLRAYYGALLGRELPGLDEALRAEDWAEALECWLETVKELVAHPELRLDLHALARPFGRQFFTDREAFAQQMIRQLVADAAGSAAGTADPVKMAIGALSRGRALIKEFVADGGITEASWLKELRGWFEGLVEGLASGPPALRIEQLAALVRSGLVRFVGPDPVFGATSEGFWSCSPWVAEEPVVARALVEAMAPANRVTHTASVLLRQLLREGMVRPRTMLAAEGVPVVTSGLDVTMPPYQARDADGAVQRGLYVIGLQLSSVQWGTAIAAQAHAEYPSGHRTLVDADAIAADILR